MAQKPKKLRWKRERHTLAKHSVLTEYLAAWIPILATQGDDIILIDAFAGTTQAAVTGEVRLRFSQGVCAPAGRRSPHSLYDYSLATYGSNDSFDAGDAAGFIKLWSLPTTEWSKRKSD